MKTVIGIDPGTHTGVAIIAPDATMELKQMGFWDTYHFLTRFYDRNTTAIVIEAGGENKRIYHREARNWGAIAETGKRVGGANREAELLAEGLEKWGFTVIRVKPTKTKWTAAECAQITGYAGRTSQHKRDALRLAYDHWRVLRLERKKAA